MPLFIGQHIERAWYFRSELERPEAERRIKAAIIEEALEHGASLTAPEWETLEPGDERIDPARPEKWREARVLVGRCLVVDITRPVQPESFLAGLERKDLDRLRSVTRVMHRRAKPKAPPLTDAECDEIIEDIGPQVGAQMLADAVNRRLVN